MPVVASLEDEQPRRTKAHGSATQLSLQEILRHGIQGNIFQYVAIVLLIIVLHLQYLTTVSFEENWWHTCLLLVLCSTGGSEPIVDTQCVLNKTNSPPPDCEWIVIPARFVTRLNPTPRTVADVCRISSEALEEVFSKAIASQHEGGIVLCKGEKSDTELSSKTWTAGKLGRIPTDQLIADSFFVRRRKLERTRFRL